MNAPLNETSITFRGFESEQDHAHLMDYLRDQLGSTLDDLVPDQRHHLDLKVHHQKLRGSESNHMFECEAIAWIGGERNPVVVRRTDRNFYKAANLCNQALKKALTHRSRLRMRSQRHIVPAASY